jgi:hypothetical protein
MPCRFHTLSTSLNTPQHAAACCLQDMLCKGNSIANTSHTTLYHAPSTPAVRPTCRGIVQCSPASPITGRHAGLGIQKHLPAAAPTPVTATATFQHRASSGHQGGSKPWSHLHTHQQKPLRPPSGVVYTHMPAAGVQSRLKQQSIPQYPQLHDNVRSTHLMLLYLTRCCCSIACSKHERRPAQGILELHGGTSLQ